MQTCPGSWGFEPLLRCVPAHCTTVVFQTLQTQFLVPSLSSFSHQSTDMSPSRTDRRVENNYFKWKKKKKQKKPTPKKAEKVRLKSQLSFLLQCQWESKLRQAQLPPYPLHTKGESHTHHYCSQGLENALSPLYPHYMSSVSWSMCCTSNAVQCWQGWCPLTRTHTLLLPTVPQHRPWALPVTQWIKPGPPSAWRCQKENCHSTATQIDSPTTGNVQAVMSTIDNVLGTCGKNRI